MFGYLPSQFTNDEIVYSSNNTQLSKYKIKDLLPIINQGSSSICCSVVCSEIQNNINKYTKKGCFDINYIYNNRSNIQQNGMSPKEAFNIMKQQGYITDYARILNKYCLKDSIIVNGPAMLILPVYSDELKFWNGNNYQGAHAVSAVGFDDSGFLIKNSWGADWGNSGYTILPYDDFDKVIEAWCVIC